MGRFDRQMDRNKNNDRIDTSTLWCPVQLGCNQISLNWQTNGGYRSQAQAQGRMCPIKVMFNNVEHALWTVADRRTSFSSFKSVKKKCTYIIETKTLTKFELCLCEI